MVKAKKAKADADDKSGFPDKWKKKLPTGWDDSANSMDTDELKKVIVDCRGVIADIEKDIENDDGLKVLREDAKLKTSAYKDAQGVEDAKIRYSLYLLRERGLR